VRQHRDRTHVDSAALFARPALATHVIDRMGGVVTSPFVA
jgi:hypothetical protein